MKHYLQGKGSPRWNRNRGLHPYDDYDNRGTVRCRILTGWLTRPVSVSQHLKAPTATLRPGLNVLQHSL